MIDAQRATRSCWPSIGHALVGMLHYDETARRRRRDRRGAETCITTAATADPSSTERTKCGVAIPQPRKRRRAGFTKRIAGGGSLLDYAGYGATLGTWFQGGRQPIEGDLHDGLTRRASIVDEHSVTVCRYAHGLSTIQTRWGTFSDPWIHQPAAEVWLCRLRHAGDHFRLRLRNAPAAAIGGVSGGF